MHFTNPKCVESSKIGVLNLKSKTSIMKKLLTLTMLLILCNIGILKAQTIYVHAGASGSNNGTSWTNAYTNLATAINNAPSGANLWVAAGTYRFVSGSPRSSSFQITNKSLNFFGGFPTAGNPSSLSQRNPFAMETIISGDIENNDPTFLNTTNNSTSGREDNAYHVISISQNMSSYTVNFDGIVIEGGNANGGAVDTKIGAAVYYRRNINGDQNGFHNILFRNCKIRNNTAENGAFIASKLDFLHCRQVNIQIHNSQIFNNNATDFPIHFSQAPANVVVSYFFEMIGNVVFNNANFNNNGSGLIHATSNATYSGSYSGYKYQIHFNTFSNNTFPNALGGIICAEGATQNTRQSSLEAGNNIVYGNTTEKFLYSRSGQPKIQNFYLDYNMLQETDSFTLQYDGGNTLIGINPNMTNSGSMNYLDYKLSNCSQAINSGNLTIYSKDQSSAITIVLPYSTDIASQPRTTHGVLDRGALEYQESNYPVTTTLNENICFGETFLFDGDELNATGLYSKTYSRSGNCDSIVKLNLIVRDDFVININAEEVAGVLYIGVAAEGQSQGGFSGYQWYKNDTLLVGETNFFTPASGVGYYHCIVTKSQLGSSCVKKSPIYNLGMPALNIPQLQAENIQVYPNPTQNLVSWNLDNIGTVTLYDNFGRAIAQTQENFFELGNLPSGIYYLKFENTIGVTRVIKN